MRTNPSTSAPTWEAFCDTSYWDMWAVRPVNERRWGHCFHLPSQGEAESLRDLLNSYGVKSLEPKDVTTVPSIPEKNVVFFYPPAYFHPHLGSGEIGFVRVESTPGTPDGYLRTTSVTQKNNDGSFETLNSVYIPVAGEPLLPDISGLELLPQS